MTVVVKPENMCEELGCTRDWEIELTQYGQPLMAPRGSTAMKIKVCVPCAEKRADRAEAR
jgi:hypothetical protein